MHKIVPPHRDPNLKKTDPYLKEIGVCLKACFDPSHCLGSNYNLLSRKKSMHEIFKTINFLFGPPQQQSNSKYYKKFWINANFRILTLVLRGEQIASEKNGKKAKNIGVLMYRRTGCGGAHHISSAGGV